MNFAGNAAGPDGAKPGADRTAIDTLRATIASLLAEGGHVGPIADEDSLFLSGRLDSVAAAEVLGILECDHGVDLSDVDFDILRIDTLAQIEALIRPSA